MPFVRIAELRVDPELLERYTAALTEEIEQSVGSEPGVLAIHAVTDKDQPSHFRLFEIYADEAGYQAHIRSPHFLK